MATKKSRAAGASRSFKTAVRKASRSQLHEMAEDALGDTPITGAGMADGRMMSGKMKPMGRGKTSGGY